MWYKKDTAEITQLYLFCLIAPKNYTTLKPFFSLFPNRACFTTIKNHTTLKQLALYSPLLNSFTTIENYTTLKPLRHTAS